MKIECVHVYVTGSPCYTVEKNCIGEIILKVKLKNDNLFKILSFIKSLKV